MIIYLKRWIKPFAKSPKSIYEKKKKKKKTLQKVDKEGTYHNKIKATYSKPTDNNILSSKRLKAFPLRSRTRQGYPHSPRSNIVLKVLLLLLLLSHFSRVQLCATPQTAAHQASLSLGFSRQEHQSSLLFPYPMHESEK